MPRILRPGARTTKATIPNSMIPQRQRHAEDLATEGGHYEPIVARPPSALYRLQKLVRRQRLAVAAVVSTVLVMVLALVALSIINVQTASERNEKEVALKAKETALDAARKSMQEARDQLFAALCSQAEAHRFSRKSGQRFDSLAALTEAVRIRRVETLRDDAIAAMALPDVRRGPSWPGVGKTVKEVGFDDLYQRVAWMDEQGLIRICTIPGNHEVQQLTSDTEALTFSRDSRLLAAAGSPGIVCFDLATGLERNRWRTPATANCLAFHPGNQKLAVAYCSGSNEISM